MTFYLTQAEADAMRQQIEVTAARQLALCANEAERAELKASIDAQLADCVAGRAITL